MSFLLQMVYAYVFSLTNGASTKFIKAEVNLIKFHRKDSSNMKGVLYKILVPMTRVKVTVKRHSSKSFLAIT